MKKKCNFAAKNHITTYMKRILLSTLMFATALFAGAQGNNTGMGDENDDEQSLAERVFKLEKKNDAFNVYFNYAASGYARDNEGDWRTGFANRELRLEILGHITDKLYYRLRHQLNKSNAARSQDNFARATDLMFVGYDFTPKFSVQAGKLCQTWGGFEYDENPMFIYQYSDLVDRMSIFKAGVNVIVKPVESQEIVLQLTDDSNGRLAEEYGEDAKAIGNNFNTATKLKEANHPFAFIVNWNGNFFDNKLQTRWAWGIQNEAHHKYARMVMLGQQLNLPKLQWYVDYMYSTEGLDRLRIASDDAKGIIETAGLGNAYLSDVHYSAWVTKLNWQFCPKWNLILKGMYETANVKNVDILKDYKKSYGYLASLEYFPIKHQNLRIFLAYIGRKFDYSDKCGLKDYDTNRIELGMMYRMKVY